MGLLDAVREALGWAAEAEATRDADPEDLFGLSTGYVTMAAELDFDPAGVAALCFGDVASTDFAAAVSEVRAVLDLGEAETGTVSTVTEDAHGYRWVVLRDDDFEDLVAGVHFAADTLVEHGYGNRLLAAVFAFERADGRRVYWLYSFRRGTFYPFAPEPDERARDDRLEFRLRAVLDGELAVEDDEAYWYPLWPDEPGDHPWE